MTPLALSAADAPARPRRRLSRLPLAAKLAFGFIGLVALVLIVNGTIDAGLSYRQAKRAALEVQAEKARAAAERVGVFLDEIQTELGWTAGVEWGYAKLEQQRYDFIRLLRQAPAITALSYIDGKGRERLAVSRLEPDAIASDKDFSADPRFTRAVADKVWFGPVEFRRGSEPYMTIALAHVGKTPGVTVADVNLKLVWDVVSAIHVGDKGFAYVVDDHGRLIAHPDLSLVLRDTDFSMLPQVAAALKTAGAGAAEAATSHEGAAVLTSYAVAPKTHWVVFVEQPLVEALATAYHSLARSLALLGLGLALAAVSGVGLARRMAAPIRALQAGAEKLGAGDLEQRLDIRTGDEIEALAGGFNRMAERLQESYENLEGKVEARTRDLNEALAQQTATAEVLKTISRSAFDLQAVLDALIASAVELVGGYRGAIFLRDKDDVIRLRASSGDQPSFQFLRSNPPTPGRGSLSGRVLLSRSVEIIEDVTTDRELTVPRADENRRSGLGAPLLREGRIEGVLVLFRNWAGSFSGRQIELVSTFCDQAVIAIENTRLFEEVQDKTHDLEQSLAQQTATADVLKAISRSAFDLDGVLKTLVESARELCDASLASINVVDGEFLRLRALAGGDPEFEAFLRDHPVPVAAPTRASNAGRVLLTREASYIEDATNEPDYDFGEAPHRGGFRSLLGVPLMRESAVIGVFQIGAPEPNALTQRQIDLVRTFADQAVIAIENSRLFTEVQARTRELEQSLSDLRKAQDRLVQSEKLASLGQLTAGIAHEIKNPLNFVNNFASLSRELMEELRETLQMLPEDVRADADDLVGMIDSNLEKVASHGKRADSIVKNMLLHSREGTGERTKVNINAMVEEALNLGYHGARAEKPGFNVTLEKRFDPKAGEADVYLQEVTRVLLNLISNGFYASAKRKRDAGADYEPSLRATTRDLGHNVEIRIRDNGAGIPDEVRAKMFNPFFTTKPAGEGTGLGLSLSHDIVVKQHGGTLDVETEPGVFAEFIITLPRGETGT